MSAATSAAEKMDQPPPNYPVSFQAPPPVVYATPQSAPQVPPTAAQIPLTAAQIGQQYQAGLMAECAAGRHDRTTKYGICGIITAVALFPIGLICLFADTQTRCARCGIRLD